MLRERFPLRGSAYRHLLYPFQRVRMRTPAHTTPTPSKGLQHIYFLRPGSKRRLQRAQLDRVLFPTEETPLLYPYRVLLFLPVAVSCFLLRSPTKNIHFIRKPEAPAAGPGSLTNRITHPQPPSGGSSPRTDFAFRAPRHFVVLIEECSSYQSHSSCLQIE